MKTPEPLCINHRAELCLHKTWRPFEIIINVLVSSYRFIRILMLWVYNHYKYVNYFSTEIVFMRQNLTSTDVRFWRMKTIPVLTCLTVLHIVQILGACMFSIIPERPLLIVSHIKIGPTFPASVLLNLNWDIKPIFSIITFRQNMTYVTKAHMTHNYVSGYWETKCSKIWSRRDLAPGNTMLWLYCYSAWIWKRVSATL